MTKANPWLDELGKKKTKTNQWEKEFEEQKFINYLFSHCFYKSIRSGNYFWHEYFWNNLIKVSFCNL